MLILKHFNAIKRTMKMLMRSGKDYFSNYKIACSLGIKVITSKCSSNLLKQRVNCINSQEIFLRNDVFYGYTYLITTRVISWNAKRLNVVLLISKLNLRESIS